MISTGAGVAKSGEAKRRDPSGITAITRTYSQNQLPDNVFTTLLRWTIPSQSP